VQSRTSTSIVTKNRPAKGDNWNNCNYLLRFQYNQKAAYREETADWVSKRMGDILIIA
jgi:hypothetical protein